jgi:hypothetical protein
MFDIQDLTLIIFYHIKYALLTTIGVAILFLIELNGKKCKRNQEEIQPSITSFNYLMFCMGTYQSN